MTLEDFKVKARLVAEEADGKMQPNRIAKMIRKIAKDSNPRISEVDIQEVLTDLDL